MVTINLVSVWPSYFFPVSQNKAFVCLLKAAGVIHLNQRLGGSLAHLFLILKRKEEWPHSAGIANLSQCFGSSRTPIRVHIIQKYNNKWFHSAGITYLSQRFGGGPAHIRVPIPECGDERLHGAQSNQRAGC